MKDRFNFTMLFYVVLAIAAVFSLSGAGELTAEAADDVVTINYYCWYPPEEILNPIIEEFEQLNPGIKVVVTKTEPDTHKQKVPLALASGQPIDLLAVNANTSFIKQVSEHLVELPALYEKERGADWKGLFNDGVLDYMQSLTPDGSLKLLPEGYNGSPVVYYNGDIFKELGLSVPTSEAELKEIVDIIREKKPEIMPIAFRGKMGKLHAISAFGLYSQEQELWSGVRDDGKPYNSPEMAGLASWWQSLFTREILSQEVMDVDNNMISEVFFSGDAAMMIHGAWMAGLLSEQFRNEQGIEINEIGAFGYPAITEGNTPTTAATLDMLFGVVDYSEHKEEALKLLSFFVLDKGLEMLADNFLIVPSKTGFEVNEELLTSDVALEGYNNIVNTLSNPQNALRKQDSLTIPFGKVLQSIALGADVQESLDEFQKDAESGKYQ